MSTYNAALGRGGYRVSTNTLFAQTMGFVAAHHRAVRAGRLRRPRPDRRREPDRLRRRVRLPVRHAVHRAPVPGSGDDRPAGRRSACCIGVAVAPTIAYYAATDPQALWKAGGATALFIGALGSAGYATRRDLSGLARVCFWALLALLVFGVVTIFVKIPGGSMIYSVAGLFIFAGFTMVDFQRLRRSQDIASAPLLAASIFLDILNVFLFFLRIFGRR
jgi:hypothetical protein